MLLSSLRQQILDRAIRGQLVEQRPEEGTAEELYQQIQAEKQRLIAEGKIKKEKPLPLIEESEIPFDIPETWKWVRLGDCTNFGQTKKKTTSADITEDTWIADLEDIEKITGRLIRRTTLKERAIAGDKTIFNKGNILFSKLRPYLQKILIAEESGVCTSELVPFSPYGNIDTFYIVHVLKSPTVDETINISTYGMKMPRVGRDTMLNLLIPLPPKREQERIAQKIETLFAALDTVESSQKRISAIQTELAKRILDKAIQGKLVPQRPEEGTAEDLYQQIQAEKKRLIASGTIKKEKPLPPIEESEIPFDIPETWKWVRLGACGTFTRGSGIKKTEVVDEGLPCVRYGQLYTTYKTRFSEAVSYIPAELFAKCKQANQGDILMALTGENKVDIAMAVLYEGTPTLAISGDMTKFTPLLIDPLYLVYTLNSPYGINCKTERSTGDIIVHTSNDKLSTIPIPLPPYAEQKRIVAKIEEMLKLCKSMQ